MEKLLVEICAGTACLLLGSQDLFAAIDALPDNIRQQIDLCEVTCLHSCRQGPNVRIAGQVISNMKPDRLMEIIEDYLRPQEAELSPAAYIVT
ncbi:thioredoxin-like protein [Anaerospora hongkongensis]|uniref:Thioredoxin-like protein n=1 Tax=Anaerospora hongkongensis TaxID=244830 RepID=A0A4R1PXW6_9FIRM|nr:NAD(P)H-dependent oxidoreductase subunit E [Anaerospora hongkongensis]TCL37611.1 thioredoxin-like protein [Anaerospora hongkongensis]